jgi:hypothetical protein
VLQKIGAGFMNQGIMTGLRHGVFPEWGESNEFSILN